jgi:hypothetical protein
MRRALMAITNCVSKRICVRLRNFDEGRAGEQRIARQMQTLSVRWNTPALFSIERWSAAVRRSSITSGVGDDIDAESWCLRLADALAMRAFDSSLGGRMEDTIVAAARSITLAALRPNLEHRENLGEAIVRE